MVRFISMKVMYGILAAAALALAAFLWWYGTSRSGASLSEVTDFASCVEAGYPVLESYPRQCQTPRGARFVEAVAADWSVSYTNASSDLIRNVDVAAGDSIHSPLTITGEARGFWFFEASFPVVLTDWDGRIIAETFATAQSDWMTESFVPFEVTLEFKVPPGPGGTINRGTLILQRDNPSGLPENDAALEIPIVFE